MAALTSACGGNGIAAIDGCDASTPARDAADTGTETISDVRREGPPYTLTITIVAQHDQQAVQNIGVSRLAPRGEGPTTTYNCSPGAPQFSGGEYAPSTTTIENVVEPAVVIMGGWSYVVLEGGREVTYSSRVFELDRRSVRYVFRGRIQVTDQHGRRWTGTPFPVKNLQDLWLRFTPEPCPADLIDRASDDICVR